MLFGNASVSQLLASVVALLIAFTFHEASHALVAYRLGDDTAKRMGRLTLNPLAHLDPLGTIMIFVASFGWGKPVPVNPYKLRRPGGQLGMGLVSAAGPVSNLILAWALSAPFRAGLIGTIAPVSEIIPSVGQILYTTVLLNVFLAVLTSCLYRRWMASRWPSPCCRASWHIAYPGSSSTGRWCSWAWCCSCPICSASTCSASSWSRWPTCSSACSCASRVALVRYAFTAMGPA